MALRKRTVISATLWCFSLLFVVSVHASDSVAVSYEQVRGLYRSALEAIATIDDANERDIRSSEIAREALRYEDYELADLVLRTLTRVDLRTELLTRIAFIHAKHGDCDGGKQSYDAVSQSAALTKQLKAPYEGQPWTLQSLKNATRFLALCERLDDAEKMLQLYEPGALSEKQHRVDIYSAMGAALHLAGREQQAQNYFQKAKSIARPIEDETHRSHALQLIARSEYAAKLYGDAVRTTLEITPTKRRPIALAAHFSEYRNSLLQYLAYHFARNGSSAKAFELLDERRESADDFIPEDVIAALVADQILKEKDAALKFLSEMEHRVRATTRREPGLICVAMGFAKVGARDRAEKLLKEIYSEIGGARTDAELKNLDLLLAAFVLVSNSPQKTFTILQEATAERGPREKFEKAWGSLVGYAIHNNDERLRSAIGQVLGGTEEATGVSYGTFQYLLEIDDFENAAKIAETMVHREKASAYLRLAREKMGLSYRDHRQENSMHVWD